MATEPELNADDIQGNILVGFRRSQQYLVGFTGATLSSLRQALQLIGSLVTTIPAVLEHKDERKMAFLAGRGRPQRSDLWLNYAIGMTAMNLLDLKSLQGDDLALTAGMVPSRTGDSKVATLPNGSPNLACPDNWIVGGPKHPLDLLLIFAADQDIQNASAQIVQQVETFGLKKIYEEEGHLLPGDAEHFGFQDGISQPGFYGTVEIDGAKRFLTTRYGVAPMNGVDFGKPAQPLQDPFQFIFDSSDPLLQNSSYLVFRRLNQDVAKFYSVTDQIAGSLATATEPGLAGDTLRARMIGRWPSGEPVMRQSAPPHAAESTLALNYFQFGIDSPDLTLRDGEKIPGATGDPEVERGGRCPVWAHIRKVNPRDQQTDIGGPDNTRGFQMLRRGIPFGPLYDHKNPANSDNQRERGLLFLSYQRSISNQFEQLNGDWMNSASNPTPYGFDLLVGQQMDAAGLNGPRDADYFSSKTGTTERFTVPSQWIFPTGGAYLFAPSVSLTKRLGSV